MSRNIVLYVVFNALESTSCHILLILIGRNLHQSSLY